MIFTSLKVLLVEFLELLASRPVAVRLETYFPQPELLVSQGGLLEQLVQMPASGLLKQHGQQVVRMLGSFNS